MYYNSYTVLIRTLQFRYGQFVTLQYPLIVIRTNIILFYTAKIYMYAAKYALDIGKNNINLLSFTQLCHER